MTRLFKSIILGAFALSLSACATATGPDALSRFDDFLVVTEANYSGFDRVYIAPIDVDTEVTDRIGYRPRGTQDRIRPLDQGDIDSQRAELREDVERELGAVATLVDAPGPGILTVEVTLLDLQSSRPTQADLAATPGLSFQSVYAGGARMGLVLAENGRVLARAEDGEIESLAGRPRPIGVWEDAERVYMRFADKVASLLE